MTEGLVAVTGATGFVGSYLVPHLVAQGWKVRAYARSEKKAAGLAGPGVEVVRGDLSDSTALARLVSGCDAVVHLAAVADSSDPKLNHEVNVVGSRNLVAACRQEAVLRILNVSSTCAGRDLQDAYGSTKLIAEEEFTGPDLRVTHLRPTMIYGHGSKEFDLFAGVVGRLPRVPIPGDGRAVLRPVYLGDFLELIERVLGHEGSVGATYDVAGPESITIADFIELLARVQGNRARALGIPAGAAIFGARVLGKLQKAPFINVDQVMAFLQDTVVDIQPARNDLSWDPRPLEEGLGELFGTTT